MKEIQLEYVVIPSMLSWKIAEEPGTKFTVKLEKLYMPLCAVSSKFYRITPLLMLFKVATLLLSVVYSFPF